MLISAAWTPSRAAAAPAKAPPSREQLQETLDQVQILFGQAQRSVEAQGGMVEELKQAGNRANRWKIAGLTVSGLGVVGMIGSVLAGLSPYPGAGVGLLGGLIFQIGERQHKPLRDELDQAEREYRNRLCVLYGDAEPALRQVREALQALDARAIAEMAGKLNQVGQILQDDQALYLPGVRLRRRSSGAALNG